MKRKQNTTGLKIKYLQPTNTKGSRYKITHFCNVLENVECIENYSLLIDNTQNDYYLFNIDLKGYGFDNILNYFS